MLIADFFDNIFSESTLCSRETALVGLSKLLEETLSLAETSRLCSWLLIVSDEFRSMFDSWLNEAGLIEYADEIILGLNSAKSEVLGKFNEIIKKPIQGGHRIRFEPDGIVKEIAARASSVEPGDLPFFQLSHVLEYCWLNYREQSEQDEGRFLLKIEGTVDELVSDANYEYLKGVIKRVVEEISWDKDLPDVDKQESVLGFLEQLVSKGSKGELLDGRGRQDDLIYQSLMDSSPPLISRYTKRFLHHSLSSSISQIRWDAKAKGDSFFQDLVSKYPVGIEKVVGARVRSFAQLVREQSTCHQGNGRPAVDANDESGGDDKRRGEEARRIEMDRLLDLTKGYYMFIDRKKKDILGDDSDESMSWAWWRAVQDYRREKRRQNVALITMSAIVCLSVIYLLLAFVELGTIERVGDRELLSAASALRHKWLFRPIADDEEIWGRLPKDEKFLVTTEQVSMMFGDDTKKDRVVLDLAKLFLGHLESGSHRRSVGCLASDVGSIRGLGSILWAIDERVHGVQSRHSRLYLELVEMQDKILDSIGSREGFSFSGHPDFEPGTEDFQTQLKRHTYDLAKLRILDHAVQIGEYRAFLKIAEGGPVGLEIATGFVGRNSEPAIVHWQEAYLFSRWLGGNLPSESDWAQALESCKGLESCPVLWFGGKADLCKFRDCMMSRKGRGCGVHVGGTVGQWLREKSLFPDELEIGGEFLKVMRAEAASLSLGPDQVLDMCNKNGVDQCFFEFSGFRPLRRQAAGIRCSSNREEAKLAFRVVFPAEVVESTNGGV